MLSSSGASGLVTAFVELLSTANSVSSTASSSTITGSSIVFSMFPADLQQLMVKLTLFLQDVWTTTLGEYRANKYVLHALHIKSPVRGSAILTNISQNLRKTLSLQPNVMTSTAAIVSHLTAWNVLGYIVLAVLFLWGTNYLANVSFMLMQWFIFPLLFSLSPLLSSPFFHLYVFNVSHRNLLVVYHSI